MMSPFPSRIRTDLIMRHSLFRRMQCCLLMGTLLGLCSCASLMEVSPTPPAFMASVALDGPYDADIPVPQISQIKKAGLMMDWAVPYLFIRVATHFESAGDPERSIHFFDRAMEEFRKRNNARGEGSAFSRKISSLYHFGKTQAAYRAIEAQEKRWPEAPLNAFVAYNYGFYYLQNGDHASARKYFSRVLAVPWSDPDDPDLLVLRRDAELGYGMALILKDTFSSVSGRLCVADFDEAFSRDIRRNVSEGLPHLEQVPRLHEKILNSKVYRYFPEMIPSFLECDLYNFLGLAYGLAGNIPAAVKNLEEAASLARKNEYRLGEADNILFLSQVYLLAGNREQGIGSARKLAETAGRYQLVAYSIWASMILAHHDQTAGDVDRTIDHLIAALGGMENNISWLPQDRDYRGIGLFRRSAVYEKLLELQYGKGDARGAFKTAERAKAAAVADWFVHEVAGTTPAAEERLKRLRDYRRQLGERYVWLFSPALTASAFRQTLENLTNTRKNYADELQGLKAEDEALDSLIAVTPSDAGEIQRLLDHDTTIFTYYVAEHDLYTWVISRRGFHHEKTKISRVEVDRLIQLYHEAMLSRDKSQANVVSEKVYDLFLKRVIPFVSGDRIGIVPHGTLHNLPFASMRYVQSYLVDGFSLFYLPHAGMIKQALSKTAMPDTRKRLVFAGPLPAPEEPPARPSETEILKGLFPRADFLAGENGSKASLQKLTAFYDWIHLAAVCSLVEDAPLDSGLHLAATGDRKEWLDVRDIVRLRLKGRTAVLSSCRIKGDWSATGAGITALASGWLYAVSPSVITSLWHVDEKTRAAWTEIFYRHLEQNGRPADALRAAQNEMIQKGYGSYEWGAFILIGRY